MGMGDIVLHDIQELICLEAFPKIPNYRAPKLKQHEHQRFSNNQKTPKVHQHWQQTWELDSNPISIHAAHLGSANTAQDQGWV